MGNPQTGGKPQNVKKEPQILSRTIDTRMDKRSSQSVFQKGNLTALVGFTGLNYIDN